MFTQREPADVEDKGEGLGRDVFNEKTAKEMEVAAKGITKSLEKLPEKAVLYTSMGEIFVDFYP